MKKFCPLIVLWFFSAASGFAASAITTRLDDPKAVYLSSSEFHARGDGRADDSAAIQAAIDKAHSAAGVLWRAGETSLIDDVRFLGGHGSGTNPYNNNHTADPDLHKRWDGQYPSLWVTDGGGGTFADIWTPNTLAQAGSVGRA